MAFTVAMLSCLDLVVKMPPAPTAENAAINLRGSGTSIVLATKTAEVDLRGSGDVEVYGNPSQRNINKSGSGEVDFK